MDSRNTSWIQGFLPETNSLVSVHQREYRACFLQASMTSQVKKYMMKFLVELNDSFAQVKTQSLLMDPLPPINKVYSLLIQEEMQ